MFSQAEIELLTHQSTSMSTNLETTAENNHLEIVKYLHKKGADVNKCENNDMSPLYIASETQSNMLFCKLTKDYKGKYVNNTCIQ